MSWEKIRGSCYLWRVRSSNSTTIQDKCLNKKGPDDDSKARVGCTVDEPPHIRIYIITDNGIGSGRGAKPDSQSARDQLSTGVPGSAHTPLRSDDDDRAGSEGGVGGQPSDVVTGFVSAARIRATRAGLCGTGGEWPTAELDKDGQGNLACHDYTNRSCQGWNLCAAIDPGILPRLRQRIGDADEPSRCGSRLLQWVVDIYVCSGGEGVAPPTEDRAADWLAGDFAARTGAGG